MVEVVCATPERVVNLCAAGGVPFWNVRWLTAERLRFTTTRSGERRLREIMAELDAEVSVVERSAAAVCTAGRGGAAAAGAGGKRRTDMGL